MQSYSKGFIPLETKGRYKRDRMSLAGFTLLEIMIATAVLVIALTAILASYIACFELIAISKNLSLAMNACQAKIEEIRDFAFTQIPTFYNNYTFEVAQMPAGSSKGVVLVDSSDPDLLQVTVTVCWRQPNGRVIGEDKNLNGILDASEGSGTIDSPAQLVTLITQR